MTHVWISIADGLNRQPPGKRKEKLAEQDTEPKSHEMDCRHHIMLIPRGCKRIPYDEMPKHVKEVFRALALQKEGRIKEEHLLPDHAHTMLSISPKYLVLQGGSSYIEGKRAIHSVRVYALARRLGGTKK